VPAFYFSRHMRIVSKVLFLLFVVSSLNAETKTWSRSISFNSGTSLDKNDSVIAVIPTNSEIGGAYMIAGSSNSFECCLNDVWFMMLNQNGSIVSQKRYDTGQNDFLASIERVYDGYILVGASIRNGAPDAWIMKVNHAGNIQWQKFVGSDDADTFARVKQTPDKGFIVLGENRNTPNKNWAIWLVKFSASGEIEWQKSYDSGKSGSNYSLALAPGGFIIAGPNFSTIRFDDFGNILWNKSYGGPKYDQAFAIVQAPEEGFIMTGSTVSFGKGSRNLWIVRIDASGRILWQKAIGLSDIQDGQAIIRSNDGGNIIAGRTDSIGAGGSDGFVVKIDRSGNIQWERTYGGSLFDSLNSVRPTHDRGYVAAGSTKSFHASKYDAWVLKVDENGLLNHCSTIGKAVFIPAENSNATAVNRSKSELPVSTQILDREFKDIYLDRAAAFGKNNCTTGN
jgi:hypothetical protein